MTPPTQSPTALEACRIAIIGPGGAGKSRLARRLGAISRLPVVHLDREYWLPDWTPTPEAEWVHRVEELVAEDRWILDGNFGGTLEQRFARAGMVIYLDYPRRTCIRRVLLRWWRYRGRNRPDLPAGCDEKIDPAFLKWLWTYPSLRRPETLALLRGVRAAGKQVVHLRSDREVRRFLAALRPERGA